MYNATFAASDLRLHWKLFFTIFISAEQSETLACSINTNVFFRVKECTLLQCFPYRCVGICRLSYFDSVRDYLLSGI